jgi:hypothetical protein
MSSAAIMAAIRVKENEIQICGQIIKELIEKLKKQRPAAEKFDSHSGEYEQIIGVKRRKADSVVECAHVNNLADKFGVKMDTVFNSATWSEQQSNMMSISSNMTTEIQENEDKQTNEELRLTRLQGELSSLYSQYEAALRREAEEAAAAAAAAAASTNKK